MEETVVCSEPIEEQKEMPVAAEIGEANQQPFVFDNGVEIDDAQPQ